MIVLSLCAMVKTVQSSNWVLMVDWMRSSVSRSIAAVASSRMRMRDFLRRARAKHTSCLWPTLQTHNSIQSMTQHLHTGWFTLLLCLLHTWGSRLPPSTPSPASPSGCWQTCGGETAPGLSTPPRHCTSQKGPGSSSVSRRRAQAPEGDTQTLLITASLFLLVKRS